MLTINITLNYSFDQVASFLLGNHCDLVEKEVTVEIGGGRLTGKLKKPEVPKAGIPFPNTLTFEPLGAEPITLRIGEIKKIIAPSLVVTLSSGEIASIRSLELAPSPGRSHLESDHDPDNHRPFAS